MSTNLPNSQTSLTRKKIIETTKKAADRSARNSCIQNGLDATVPQLLTPSQTTVPLMHNSINPMILMNNYNA